MVASFEIPVVANGDFEKLIGKAVVEDDVMIIRISKEQLLRELAFLVTLDQIKCLTIGIDYEAAQPKIPLTFNFDEKIGTVDKIEETDEGLMVTGTVDAEHAHLIGGTSFTGHIPKDGL